MEREIFYIIEIIDKSIKNNDFKKAFFLLILLLGKLDENDKNDVLVYYKHMFLSKNIL